jgi:hypothetical protein
MCENCVFMLVPYREFVSLVMASDSTVTLTIAMKQCMDTGAGHHVCGVLLMILMFAVTR